MKLKIWGFIALLIFSLTVVTCSGERPSTQQSQAPATESTPAFAGGGSNSETNSTCGVNLSLGGATPTLNCAVVDQFDKEVFIDDTLLSTGDQQTAPTQFIPPNTLQTGVDASATLVFNELSMAEAGPETQFQFEAGLDQDGISGDRVIKLLTSKENIETAKELFESAILISDAALGQNQSDAATSSIQTNPLNLSNNLGIMPAIAQPILTGHSKDPVYLAHAIAQDNGNKTIPTKPASLRVETDALQVTSNRAVYVVKHRSAEETSQVFSVSEEPIEVSDRNGKTVTLQGNQTIEATTEGFSGDPKPYDVQALFANESLLAGLAPGQSQRLVQKPRLSQLAYHIARSETITLYHNHTKASTTSGNCATS